MPVTEQTQTQTEVKVEAVNTQTQASTMASTRADPSRVLLAGDWHGNLGWGLAVVDHAADAHAEVIVHVGDFGIWPGSAGQRYLHLLDQRLFERGLRLAFVDGNHENFDLLDTYPCRRDGTALIRPTITHLPRGHRWSWHDQSWLALGGATSVDRNLRTPGRDWWAREAITIAQATSAAGGGHADVLICHDAPAGVAALEAKLAPNSLGLPADVLRGSRSHREMVRGVVEEVAPDYLWHGHYHWAYRDELMLPDGHRVQVSGLDMDGTTMAANTEILDLPCPVRAPSPTHGRNQPCRCSCAHRERQDGDSHVQNGQGPPAVGPGTR